MSYLCEDFLVGRPDSQRLDRCGRRGPRRPLAARVTDNRVEVVPGHVVFEKPGTYTVALLHTYELGPDVVKVKARDTGTPRVWPSLR